MGSWVQTANIEACDFPIENLPYGCFQLKNDPLSKPKIGIAIGHQILPLTGLKQYVEIPEQLQTAFRAFDDVNLNAFMALSDAIQDACRLFFIQLFVTEF